MTTLQTGDVSTYYERRGEGPPVVFVHAAILDNPGSFTATLRRFLERAAETDETGWSGRSPEPAAE